MSFICPYPGEPMINPVMTPEFTSVILGRVAALRHKIQVARAKMPIITEKFADRLRKKEKWLIESERFDPLVAHVTAVATSHTASHANRTISDYLQYYRTELRRLRDYFGEY